MRKYGKETKDCPIWTILGTSIRGMGEETLSSVQYSVIIAYVGRGLVMSNLANLEELKAKL